ncbi:MAG: hypothetical protein D6689_11345 [Deltaproteobacteria bacterium]|nr:MAG: hypothetical protein D6689_11345 [Deltaproteobacteria bacterium]
MARSRRKPPDLRDALGSFVQTALEQVGAVREVVERGAQAQRSRYDAIRLDRRRRDALAALGEAVYRRAVRGALGDLAEDPDIAEHIDEIDAIDQRIEAAASPRGGFAARSGWPRGRTRDARDVRVWRPVPPTAAPRAPDDDDERTDAGMADLADRIRREAAAAGDALADALAPRAGAVRFDDAWDDDDLEEYMHADDVPSPAVDAGRGAGRPDAPDTADPPDRAAGHVPGRARRATRRSRPRRGRTD